MRAAHPLTRDLVLIGGGHTHALVLRRWGMDPLPGARLTLIDPAPAAAYSGMLPGFVAGHYPHAALEIDLPRLAAHAGARLILGAARGIDLGARTVEVEGRPPVAFDVASIDIGITSAMPGLPGFAEHGIPAKPLGPFSRRWAAFVEERGPARVAVIGGGVAGAELAMAVAYRLQRSGREGRVTLVDRSAFLAEATPRGRRVLKDRLRALGVELRDHAPVAEVTEATLRLQDGTEIASDFSIGAAGAAPWPWLAQTGLAATDGFLDIDAYLATSDPAIFAAGDCAHMTATPRPKAGVFAVRQAPVLAHNLRAALAGRPLRAYRPQRDYLKLVSLGGRAALAERFGTALAHPLLWRWKDRIDRRFMARLNDLPPMQAAPPPRDRAAGGEGLAAPMCAGCGAKVGRGALRTALAGAGEVPTDDAAVLETGGARQVVSVDHLRAVTPDPWLMTRIAAHHALGDVWAMGARPQAALTTLILPRMSAELQRRTLAEIAAAAADVMDAAGARIVGGHSSMGDELTIGFTVTGLCEAAPITLAGARPGDALVLTKPLGSGMILAAAMAGRAGGAEVAACWSAMARGQGAAAAALADAHAMTDVTGFGLAGHLAGICEASGAGAEIDLAALPLMAGAERLADLGVRSTIWADNRTGAGPVFGADGARGALLFDPQSSGGLLAAVPDGADALARLRAAGCDGAAVIGRIVAGPPQVVCR
ncbi:selenide, water dikinase SelD [Wenxinia saemankumensis]|uniref:Selenophosphate synthase n=1 Tax=Wenxinia saemankumensis TaxID=1447782 RepID=A0A1M6BTJ8_9RHOB|nr:selenide, water dikinase SelD [Wenxinia saemankumensis]SHI52066.1 selenophosphate synthase [Wenxinia saemankumensis]